MAGGGATRGAGRKAEVKGESAQRQWHIMWELLRGCMGGDARVEAHQRRAGNASAKECATCYGNCG